MPALSRASKSLAQGRTRRPPDSTGQGCVLSAAAQSCASVHTALGGNRPAPSLAMERNMSCMSLRRQRCAAPRAGLTILELLVAIGIIGLLAALLLPAVMSARETSRRATCVSNLRQIAIAVDSYETTYRAYPSGNSQGWSFQVTLLPFTEQSALFEEIQAESDPPPIRCCGPMPAPPVYACPSSPLGPEQGRSGYAGNFGTGVARYGFNGMFRNLVPVELGGRGLPWKGGPIRPRDVVDGLSQTAAVSEILPGSFDATDRRSIVWELRAPPESDQFVTECEGTDVGATLMSVTTGYWRNGDPGETLYNHMLPPNNTNCVSGLWPTGIFSAASEHSGGVHVLFADGHASFIASVIDAAAWRALGSRNGREIGGSY